ncbi:MAG: C25 family cysteine peptidase, partial [Vicinamibacteria bacterium]
ALEIPEGVLGEGENRLEIENVGDTGAQYSMVMLDRFEVAYPRLPIAFGGRIEGLWTRSGTAFAAGLGPAHVLDVTEADPRWLGGARTSGDGTLAFRVEEGRRYVAVSRQQVAHPVVRQVARPRLEFQTLRADYLVIGPSELSSAAAPLLEHRRRQGLTVKFAATEDIYSEFGFGEARPEAIRDFLSYAYHHWREPKLRYVLLLGDATYDFKDYLRTGVRNLLPPLLVKTSYLWTASDPTFAAVHGEDMLPDVAIGRLPAASPEELRVMVAKLLSYETGDADLAGSLLLVTDNSDGAGDFEANAEEIARGVLAGRNVRRLSVAELGSATRGEIVSALDEGASLLSYVGHGGIHLWADENVFNTDDVDSLSPQAQQPLLVTMNCLNGYFHFPYFDSLSEALLKAKGKGAVAAFSPSGLSLDGPAHRFHRELLDAVLNQGHRRLGDAVLAAQSAYAESGAFPELISIYHLLGDPALILR